MIEARIRKSFDAFSLDLSFAGRDGVTAIFGPSGSGKTLTLECIAGFARPDAGRILLNDRILFDAETGLHLKPQQRRCGYVFQNYALFPHMSVRGNLEFALSNGRTLERGKQIREMLERFRLEEVAARLPHQLSGGQRQRCSIARALIGGPELILLDEASRGLDAPLRAELYAILRQVRAEFGTPMLLVTHDLDECFELADEMIVLREGRIAQSGPPAEVCSQPVNLDLARLLGIYNILPVEIAALDPSRNSSTLRLGDSEIQGPYFPGRFRGDRMHLVISPQQLRAVPRNGRPAANQVYAELTRTVETAHTTRMEFAGGLTVEMAKAEIIPGVREWAVEFPSRGLRLL